MKKTCHEAGSERNGVLFASRPTESRPSSHTESACQAFDALPALGAASYQAKRAVGDYRINEEFQLLCGCIARVLTKTGCTADPNGNTGDVYLQVVTGCCDEHRGLTKVSWSGEAIRS